jgi:hypothetical protein
MLYLFLRDGFVASQIIAVVGLGKAAAARYKQIAK